MAKLGFGKHGAESTTMQLWFVIIGLILAGLVSCSSVKKTYDDLSGTTYEKNYIAREVALSLDAVYAAPGDIEYTYSMRNYKFVVEIKNSKVFVKDTLCEPDNTAGIYDYFWNTDKPLSVSISPLPDEKDVRPMLIRLSKKSEVLSAHPSQVENAIRKPYDVNACKP